MSMTVIAGVTLGYVLEKDDFMGESETYGCLHKENKHPFCPKCGKPAKIEEKYNKINPNKGHESKDIKVQYLYEDDKINQIVIGYPVVSKISLYDDSKTRSFALLSQEDHDKIQSALTQKLKDLDIDVNVKNFGYKSWLYIS